ncbi:MAG: S-layer homology domain-containing protein [Oscillospiraceae bacterium]|nr:S-layer homology domain-containing protein [Oscillospiraceae bacterium]
MTNYQNEVLAANPRFPSYEAFLTNYPAYQQFNGKYAENIDEYALEGYQFPSEKFNYRVVFSEPYPKNGANAEVYFYEDDSINLAPQPDPISVNVSYLNDDSGFVFGRQEIGVTPGLAAEYGYSGYTGEIPNAVTALDALVALHISIFGDDVTDINEALTESGGFVTTAMYTDYYPVYFVNGDLPNDDGLGYALNDAVLQEGDVVEFFVLQDGTWLDAYVWFEQNGEKTEAVTAYVGEPLDLIVSGVDGAMMYPPDEWKEHAAPIEDAAVVLVDEDGLFADTPLDISNEDGEVSLLFDEPGEYIVSAYNYEPDYWSPIMSPWLVVTVEPAGVIESVDITNGQLLGNYNYDNNATPKYSVKVNQYDAVVWHGADNGTFEISVSSEAQVIPAAGSAERIGDSNVWTLTLPTSVDGTTTNVTVAGVTYAFTCYTQAYSGMPTRVAEYIVPGSQYTNGLGLGPYGMNGVATLRGANVSETTLNINTGPTSLGNFGGYITYYYDTPITDNPNNPYGVDFIVFGNSVGGNAAFSEPGNVLVSEDGETWYNLAGAMHYDDNALWNHEATYSSGNAFPEAAKYPLFDWEGKETAFTLSGVELLRTDTSQNAPYPDFGYADVGKKATADENNNVASNPYAGLVLEYGSNITDRTDGFDLKWAVDADGQPVTLGDIHYIKIQTATDIVNGGIGEKSTEVNGMRKAKANSTAVGETSAPTKVTIAGAEVDLESDEAITVPNGAFEVTVDTTAANVYINSVRGATRGFAAIPDHEIIRIIVQDENKAPWIGYFNLEEDDEASAPASVSVTFNTDGGTLDGATTRVYVAGTSEQLPIPTYPPSRTFDGWYSGTTKIQSVQAVIALGLPAVTLKAHWIYNTSPQQPTNVTVTFRLVGAEKLPTGTAYQNWIQTRTYTLPLGSRMSELFVKAIADAGLTQVGADKNYIESITAPSGYGGYALAEFDNGVNSGWMYTVNDHHADRGLLEYDLQNGDIVVWHYVNDYLTEIEDWFGGSQGTPDDQNKWLLVADTAPPTGNTPPAGNNDTTASGGGANTTDTTDTPDSKLAEAVTVDVPAATIKTADDGSVTAIVEVKTDAITKAVAEAVKASEGKTDTSTEVIIVVKPEEPKTGETASKVTTAELDLIVEAVKEIAAAKDVVLTIESEVATITLDNATLSGIAENKADTDTVKITASEIETALIELTVTVGNTVIHDFKGEVTVKTPYTPPVEVKTEDYDLLTVYYVDDSGNLSEVSGARFDPVTKRIVFTTTHFSRFMVAEWINPFGDIVKSDWFYKIARFSYSNNLIEGIDGNFEAARKLTRGQMFTLLAKYAGVDTSGGAKWYSKGVDWAVAQGISDGTAPERQITRGEMFQLLYNLAKTRGADVSGTADLSRFPDANEASPYTQSGLNWALANGLASGDENGKINPKGIATRVGVAGILKNYIEKTA